MKEYKSLMYDLNARVGFVLHSDSVLLRLVNKNASKYENKFDLLKFEMEDEKGKIGSICKRYIECASKKGKLDKARAEIYRMLNVAAAESDKPGSDVDEAVAHILKKYAPSPISNIQISTEEIFGKELTNIFNELGEAKSEEEALELLQKIDDKKSTINIKDVMMKLMAANKNSDKTAASKNEQKRDKPADAKKDATGNADKSKNDEKTAGVKSSKKNNAASGKNNSTEKKENQPNKNSNDNTATQKVTDAKDTLSLTEALTQTEMGQRLFTKIEGEAAPA